MVELLAEDKNNRFNSSLKMERELKVVHRNKKFKSILVSTLLLFSIFLFIFSISFTSAYCYQETANVATSCGGLNTGSYIFTGSWGGGSTSALKDGNWITYAYPNVNTNSTMVINYTKPYGALNSSLWQVKDDWSVVPSPINLTITSSCWNAYPNDLIFNMTSLYYSPRAIWQCWNGTGWDTLRTDANDEFRASSIYEEGMNWDMAQSYFTGIPANKTTTYLTKIEEYFNATDDHGIFDSFTVNDSRFNINKITNLCYQESANISTACGGLNTGKYAITYDTTIFGQNKGIFYINYTIPNGTNNAIWTIKYGSNNAIPYNVTVPNSCLKNNLLQFKMESIQGSTSIGYCKNETDWQNIVPSITSNYQYASISTTDISSRLYDGDWGTGTAYVPPNYNVFVQAYDDAARTIYTNGTIWEEGITWVSYMGNLTNATTLGVGTYIINITINTTSNFPNSILWRLDITKYNTSTTTTVNPVSPTIYPTASNFSCYNNASFIPDLYINNVNKSTERGLNTVRTAGTYNVTCIYTGNQNYSSSLQEVSYVIGQSTWNATTYETASENFNINLIIDSTLYPIPSALLIYNGTAYTTTKTGTGNNITFSKTFDIPLINSATVNKTFYWNISLNSTHSISSTLANQTVNQIQFTLCNATNNITFINYTFKDESDSSIINGSFNQMNFNYQLSGSALSKTYLFSNSTDNPNYAFCFSPADKIITYSVSGSYSSTGYVPRTYSTSGTLTNTTTTIPLYLLASTDGISTSIQVIEQQGSPISGVAVVVQKSIGGLLTTVEQGTTDSAGIVTFFLSPYSSHTLTFSKTGYLTAVSQITPTSAGYTQVLSKSSSNSSYVMPTESMVWTLTPSAGRLGLGVNTFGFNITSTQNNIYGCNLTLRLSNGTVLSSAAGCTASPYNGGNISLAYVLTNNTTPIFAIADITKYINSTSNSYITIQNNRYYIENITGYENATSSWTTIPHLLAALKNNPDFGSTTTRQAYTVIVFIFLIMCIMISMFTFFTGWDMSNPGFAFTFIFAIIFFGCAAGLFTAAGTTPWDFTDQWMPVIVLFLFYGGYMSSYFRKTGG